MYGLTKEERLKLSLFLLDLLLDDTSLLNGATKQGVVSTESRFGMMKNQHSILVAYQGIHSGGPREKLQLTKLDELTWLAVSEFSDSEFGYYKKGAFTLSLNAGRLKINRLDAISSECCDAARLVRLFQGLAEELDNAALDYFDDYQALLDQGCSGPAEDNINYLKRIDKCLLDGAREELSRALENIDNETDVSMQPNTPLRNASFFTPVKTADESTKFEKAKPSIEKACR